MKNSGFPINPGFPWVGDASVVINLNATGFSERIIRALPNSFVVTEEVLRELKNGSKSGYEDYEKLQALLGLNAVALASLGNQGRSIYLSLVGGSVRRTLGDGEASTIAHAVEVRGVAVIDDRKAKRICRENFPKIPVITTFDLLDYQAVKKALGKEQFKEAVYNALLLARMRVSAEKRNQVLKLIGKNLAANCSSLSRKHLD